MPKILYFISSINKIIRSKKPSKVCIVTSNHLAKKLNWAIKEINIPKSQVILIPDGESAKE